MKKLLRRTTGWVIAGMCALAVYALVDAALVLASSRGWRFAAATFGATLAMGLVGCTLAAMPAAGLEAACAAIARGRPSRRWLWPLPLVAVAVLVWMALTLAPIRRRDWTLAALVLFVAAIVGCAVLARSRRRGLRNALGISLALVALAIDLHFDPLDSDLHDLLGVLEIAALLSTMTDLRAFVEGRATRTLALCLAGLVVLAVGATVAAEPIAPGWRLRAVRHARMTPRLARWCRGLFDFDADGFSALFWGADCDDLDAWRNPRALERPNGIDANCNGTVLPAHPMPVDVGLAEPWGDPNLPEGAVDRLVLVTVDCLRFDAFVESLMPAAVGIARRGVTMARMYSGGTSTAVSMRFVQRVKASDPTFAAILGRQGVDTAAVFSAPLQFEGVVDGFSRVWAPERGQLRWRATEVTEAALRAVRSGHAPQVVWAHYMDLHQPISGGLLSEGVPLVRPGMTAEYREAAGRVDRAIGALVHGLEEGGGLDRTVLLLTADHGESFGAHGVRYHALDAYEELVHIPAFILAPGLSPGVYDPVVTHRDLPPTVLGAFGRVGVERGTERFGRSWLRLRGDRAQPLHRFVTTYSTASRVGDARIVAMAAVIEDRFKLTDTFENNLQELFDLENDPTESDDLLPVRPAEAARLRRELALFRDVDGFR